MKRAITASGYLCFLKIDLEFSIVEASEQVSGRICNHLYRFGFFTSSTTPIPKALPLISRRLLHTKRNLFISHPITTLLSQPSLPFLFLICSPNYPESDFSRSILQHIQLKSTNFNSGVYKKKMIPFYHLYSNRDCLREKIKIDKDEDSLA